MTDDIDTAAYTHRRPTANIPSELIRDRTLSADARWLQTVALDRPPRWRLRADDMARRTGMNRNRVLAAARELIAAGWLIRRKQQDPKTGQWATITHILDRPLPPDAQQTQRLDSMAREYERQCAGQAALDLFTDDANQVNRTSETTTSSGHRATDPTESTESTESTAVDNPVDNPAVRGSAGVTHYDSGLTRQNTAFPQVAPESRSPDAGQRDSLSSTEKEDLARTRARGTPPEPPASAERTTATTTADQPPTDPAHAPAIPPPDTTNPYSEILAETYQHDTPDQYTHGDYWRARINEEHRSWLRKPHNSGRTNGSADTATDSPSDAADPSSPSTRSET
jgi:hypothetical protein